ncbi:hypothetical protein NSP_4260 [Nodularia spumigena CCY9414]|nr:hypothetical protein NSP_4260 [Nodularia spumigena CCY9414]
MMKVSLFLADESGISTQNMFSFTTSTHQRLHLARNCKFL